MPASAASRFRERAREGVDGRRRHHARSAEDASARSDRSRPMDHETEWHVINFNGQFWTPFAWAARSAARHDGRFGSWSSTPFVRERASAGHALSNRHLQLGSLTPRRAIRRSRRHARRIVDGLLDGRLATGAATGDFGHGKATIPRSAAAIDGELTLDAAKLTLSGVPVSQQRPRARKLQGTISVADATWIVRRP